MKVSAFQSDGLLRIEEREIPKIGPGEILLKVRACGLCGTDILKVQKKSLPVGTVLGHEVAGLVVRAGLEVKNFKEGERVVVAHHVPCGNCHFCRHENESMCAQFKKTNLDPGGFAEFLRIPAEHVQNTTFKIPENLSFEEASFTEPLACCLRAIQRSNLLEGDLVIVIGLGSMGLMMVQLLKHFGMKIFATDLVEERVKLALEFGALRFEETALSKQKADMVLLTAGNNALLQKSFSWVRDGGCLHLFSSLSDGKKWPADFDVNNIYHRELELKASYSSSPEHLHEALELLVERKIDVSRLITSRPTLDGISKAIQQTLSKEILKAVVVP